MPTKQGFRAEVNNFVQGLVTEASPLNFPENGSLSEVNFELFRDGTRQRRLGMDFEIAGFKIDTGLYQTDFNTAGFNTYKWVDVAGKPDLELLVIQINNRLLFYRTNVAVVSTEGLFDDLRIPELPIGVTFSLTSIEGLLIVASGTDKICVIRQVGQGFVYEFESIKVRDLWGIQETEAMYDEDPLYRGGSEPSHYYNLQNQSWGIERLSKTTVPIYGDTLVIKPNPNYNPNKPADPETNPLTITVTETVIVRWADGTDYVDPVAAYIGAYNKAPSNSETVWPGIQYQPVGADQEPFEKMFPEMYNQIIGSTPKAAKGYFIIDALRRGQSRAEQVQLNNAKNPKLKHYSISFPTDFTPGGASLVAEFAGKVFYAGFKGEVIGGDKNSPNYSNHIFFSQFVKSSRDIARCYQEGDPTSRESADVVDTDGGFLRVSEAKDIVGMVNLGSTLIVFASNGVWQIVGGSDYGFSATNYKVAKLSTVGVIASRSIVVEGDRAYFWSIEGIHAIAKNQFGDYEVANLTKTTIQKYFDSIPNLDKIKSFGEYDRNTSKVRWIYPKPDKSVELVLDTTMGCFTINELSTMGKNLRVVAAYQGPPYHSGQAFSEVVRNRELVVKNGEPVVVSGAARASALASVRYITIENIGTVHFGFTSYRQQSFRDWISVNGNGVDAAAHVLTGAMIAGDSSIMKQMPYLVVHMAVTEDGTTSSNTLANASGCKAQVQWDFANHINSGKWSPEVQVYRYRRGKFDLESDGSFIPGFDVMTTKTKLRGRGRAFAIKFMTEPDKDCHLLGWSLTIDGNSKT